MPNHNSYFDGNVQSLGSTFRNHDYTVGVLEPGEYEFDANRFEKVRVVLGFLIDLRDGMMYTGFPDAGLSMDLPEFKPGEKVRFKCDEPVAYLCVYGDQSFEK